MSNRIGYNNIPQNGLVLDMPLDGNANARVGANGTATNVTWIKSDKGYTSKAGSFNGSSSYINTPNIVLSSYTISMVIHNTSPGYNILIDKDLLGAGRAFSCEYNYLGNKNITFYGWDNLGTIHGQTVNFNLGDKPHLINLIRDTNGGNKYIYIDGIKRSTQIISGIAKQLNTTIGIGRQFNGGNHMSGTIGLARIYNRALSQDEIHNLYLEGQRLFNTKPAYPQLLSGLVGYIRASDGGTVLYDIANGTTATYIGGTSTTDNLGQTKAISNPNYTWTSITYITGYTYENSGAGWGLVTSPAGLSSTGINRTTTLRDIFLFNKTLTASEITTINALCSKEYIYPFPRQTTLGLTKGLVMHLDKNGNDLSGNGNNGTLTAVTPTKIGQMDGGVYNGSSSKIQKAGNNGLGRINGQPITVSCWAKLNSYLSYEHFIALRDTLGFNYMMYIHTTGKELSFHGSVQNRGTYVVPLNKYEMYTCTVNNSGLLSIYVNGILHQTMGGYTYSTRPTANLVIGADGVGTTETLNGNIYEPKIRNRALTAKEVEQEYYNTKGNFIY